MDDNGLIIRKCKTCKGTGKRMVEIRQWDRNRSTYYLRECKYCDGYGYQEVDWIDNILDQKRGPFIVNEFGLNIKKTSLTPKVRQISAKWEVTIEDTYSSYVCEEASKNLAESIDTEIKECVEDESDPSYTGMLRRTITRMYERMSK